MKKITGLFVVLCISLSAHATEFKQNIHFRVLNTQSVQSPTVTEFFSFYCSHCYKFEGVIARLKQSLPTETTFERKHVSFLGGTAALATTKAYAVMVSLEKEQEMFEPTFALIQDSHIPLKSEADVREWFSQFGVSLLEFDSQYHNPVVTSYPEEVMSEFKNMGLTGVPGIVVNHKFAVIPNELKNIQEYIELVKYLLNKQ